MAESYYSESSSKTNASAESSDSTVELNIKTLDSQMFKFHVDKNIPVSVFKEKIASKTGVPVEQQRLIFRGKVLKDNHLLSEYHLDSGHTLHLVARQPSRPQSSSGTSSGETNTNTGPDSSAGVPLNRVGQFSHSLVLGPLNGAEQGESTVPDISRVIGAVLNSLGIGNHTAFNGSGGLQPTMEAPQVSEAEERQGASGGQNQAGNQSLFGQAFSSQSMPEVMQIPLGTAIPIPSLNQPISDSLHTLSEFMNRMERALSQNGNQPNQSLNGTGDPPSVDLPANSLGLPTPEALGVVLRHAQRLLSGHAIDALSRIAGRVEQEGDSADPTIRSQIQTETMQVGLVMQHLGALLLELGRTMLTLRMGQSSAESSVNAGPAVYISPLGPNPIMVQPFPLQTSSLFGGSIVPPLNPGNFVPGVGPVPRNVNIHIHAAVGPRATTGEGMQGDHVNGTGSGDSGQTRVHPVRDISAVVVPSRPSVVSVSSAVQRGSSLSQQSANSVPLSTVIADVSSQIRSFVDNMRSENQVSLAQPESSVVQDQSSVSGAGNGGRENDITISELPLPTESLATPVESHKPCNKEDTECSVNTDVPSNSSVKGTDNQSSGETVQELEGGTGCAPKSNQGSDNPEGATTIPLGLGLRGLQPRRRRRQSSLRRISGDGVTSIGPTNQNQHVRSHELANRSNASTLASSQLLPAGGGVIETIPMEVSGAGDQLDQANVMSQVLQSPALDGLLAGVSQHTGVGSPDVLRNMLGQLTQSPAMMNTVNQIAQQIDSQDFGSMFAGLSSGRSGGIDLSRMVQQMMPIVSQALGSGSTIPQQAPALEREVQPIYDERRPNIDEQTNDPYSQMDLQQVVQRLEHEDPPTEVLRSVVESVISLHDYGSGAEGLVNELYTEDGLANEFMEMLRRDISRRVQNETDSAENSRLL